MKDHIRRSGGEKELREYKHNPWVVRLAERTDLAQRQKVKITIDLELEKYNEKEERWFQSGLAGYLGILPKDITITKIEEGSTKLTLDLPVESVQKLLVAFKSNDLELLEYLSPFKILGINPLRL